MQYLQSKESIISAHEAASARNAIKYGKSWAEDIQKYQAAKATFPWMPEQQTPVKHITRYEKSREEREYDILLGKFRNAESELARQEQEKTTLTHGLERSRAKQLRTIQRFNMINHSPMYPGAKDPTDKQPTPHPYRLKATADYNIVTNMPNNNNSSGSTEGASPTKTPSRRPTREFNILTNQYHDRHDERFIAECANAKEIAAKKFYKTHDFDPIRITYVNEDKERKFLQEREEEQATHGKDRELLLLPREQFSEGRLYNILNQQVINPDKLKVMDEKEHRALNKIQKNAFETKMRILGDQQQQRETELCLNRFAHERNAETYVHGYDPITNQLYQGRDRKPTMPIRTHPALSAWQVIESGAPSTSKTLIHSRINTDSSSTDMVSEKTATRQQKKSCDEQPIKPNILIVEQTQSPIEVRWPRLDLSHLIIINNRILTLILVAFCLQTLTMPTPSVSKASSDQPAIRTGGFMHRRTNI